MSVTKFRGQSRHTVRLPPSEEHETDNRQTAQVRRIAQLEGELAEARREIERLRQAALPLSSDDERAALRAVWQQTPPKDPNSSSSLLRWLRSSIFSAKRTP